MAIHEGHICQCLSRISSLRLDIPVTISGNRQKTGYQFVAGVLSLARGLLDLGVRRGDVVAIAALNSDCYLEWLLAIAYVGGIAAPLNYRWSFEEATSAMEIVRPVMLVVDENCYSWSLQLQKLENKKLLCLRSHVFLGEPSSSLNNTANVMSTDVIRRPSEGVSALEYLSASEGIALICFTSGTTGRPKGVAISHTALIVQSLAKIAIVGYGENDVYLHTSPLCHIGGISSCMAMLMVGSCHVFIPKFEVKAAVQAIEQHNVTTLITVPAMMADLVSYHRENKTWMGGKMVKTILNGGGGLSIELIQGAIQMFPNAKLLSAYGMTETCSSLTFMTLSDPTLENSGFILKNPDIGTDSTLHSRGICVGKPAPHIELCISGSKQSYDPSTGRILTRGAHVMVGYWGQFAAMVPESSKHGWFDTGDIGWIDDHGDLWLIGRTKDKIKSGGENVYPQEVEAILSQHPGVSTVVVIGVPDARLTEMVAACVQLNENWRWIGHNNSYVLHGGERILSSKILQNYCKMRNLTGFKIPKIFICWNKPFPSTTTGKIIRDELRKEVILSHVQLTPSNL